MSQYTYPIHDVDFILKELIEFDSLCKSLDQSDINLELANDILTQAAHLASNVLEPLNTVGDIEHPILIEIEDKQAVQESPGFYDAYKEFCKGGWPSLTASEEYGGQNLPKVLGTAVSEIWQSANLSFSLSTLLNQGAIEAITQHASDALKDRYLRKMVSGDWLGTMNLTEPDAGSDLAAIKTKAVKNGDHYLICGQKIFITWGDHQMTDNIIHLVLARLPNAPAGVKGISLFLVPKCILDNNKPTRRNDVYCISLEDKLGIHASPTCTMSYGDNGGAIGYLIGEEHKGLTYMFTMMNDARQAVGLQGLAVSEASYQRALFYARNRDQGTRRDGSRFSIMNYPDVRRMLMHMKSSTEAMRALCFVASAEIDKGNVDSAEFFTPIVKGWVTELAQEITSLGIQVHGGMGYVEETGIAQFYRDARILPIYEGTTGIQALDLVGRKTLHNNGMTLKKLLDDMQSLSIPFKNLGNQFSLSSQQYDIAIEKALFARQWLLDKADEEYATQSISVNFMQLLGYLCGGWLMVKSAIKASERLTIDSGNHSRLETKLLTSQFYCEHILPRIHSHFESIKAGSESIMSLKEEHFS